MDGWMDAWSSQVSLIRSKTVQKQHTCPISDNPLVSTAKIRLRVSEQYISVSVAVHYDLLLWLRL